jgi:hypothetical protein
MVAAVVGQDVQDVAPGVKLVPPVPVGVHKLPLPMTEAVVAGGRCPKDVAKATSPIHLRGHQATAVVGLAVDPANGQRDHVDAGLDHVVHDAGQVNFVVKGVEVEGLDARCHVVQGLGAG